MSRLTRLMLPALAMVVVGCGGGGNGFPLPGIQWRLLLMNSIEYQLSDGTRVIPPFSGGSCCLTTGEDRFLTDLTLGVDFDQPIDEEGAEIIFDKLVNQAREQCILEGRRIAEEAELALVAHNCNEVFVRPNVTLSDLQRDTFDNCGSQPPIGFLNYVGPPERGNCSPVVVGSVGDGDGDGDGDAP